MVGWRFLASLINITSVCYGALIGIKGAMFLVERRRGASRIDIKRTFPPAAVDLAGRADSASYAGFRLRRFQAAQAGCAAVATLE
jgi:hypothetical protein